MAKKSAGKTGRKFGAGRGSRGGAAAFAVGLFLAGPAAVAAADAGGEATFGGVGVGGFGGVVRIVAGSVPGGGHSVKRCWRPSRGCCGTGRGRGSAPCPGGGGSAR